MKKETKIPQFSQKYLDTIDRVHKNATLIMNDIVDGMKETKVVKISSPKRKF